MAGDSRPPELPEAEKLSQGRGLTKGWGQAWGTGPRARRVWGTWEAPALRSLGPSHSADWQSSRHLRQEAASTTTGLCVSRGSLCSAGGRPSLAPVVRCHLEPIIGPSCGEEVVL